MKLTVSDGSVFCLEIPGYEFPEMETEDYDSNWLQVRVQVSHPEGEWAASAPCLLTYEVADLADWLDCIAKDELVEAKKEFTEPNLEFHLVNETNNKVLRICFELELRPPWAEWKPPAACEFWVQFPLSEVDLSEAARALRAQLSKFPQRAAR